MRKLLEIVNLFVFYLVQTSVCSVQSAVSSCKHAFIGMQSAVSDCKYAVFSMQSVVGNMKFFKELIENLIKFYKSIHSLLKNCLPSIRNTKNFLLENCLLRTTLLVTILLSTIQINAQTYPVQVTPQLVPPYSIKLSDYSTTTSEKLFVNLLLTDVNEIGRRVRLKMHIAGQGISVVSNDIIIGENPVFLDGGINLRLSNLDLQAYFRQSNLSGITEQQYNVPLPNGAYEFCFEVYDYFTNRILSNKSCTTVYLIQNDPPILNLPFRDNIVTATNPQNVLFTWTPRHTNAPNVQYEFILKELWDVRNPQANFLGSIPFYQTTTQSTTLLIGPEAPQMLSGKMYGWQVRAYVSDGVEETTVFKNDGKSEIFWFKYLEDCEAPSFVISQALNSESVRINWQISDHIKYQIQYRKKGFGDDDWFDVETYTNEGTIYSLEPSTLYEFRVGGECTPLSGYAYSNIQEFTTPSNDEAAYYNCGFTPEIDITNTDPLPSLKPNDTFTAGDFPVVVREVSGGNGVFSGWGYITLPFLENIKEIIDAVNIATGAATNEEGGGDVNIGKYTRIKVAFQGIQINTSKQLTQGVVETDYDPTWGGIIDVDDVIDDIVGDDGAIEEYDASNVEGLDNVIVTEDGTVVLVLQDGTQVPIETDKPVVVKGEDQQWTVDEDGNVSEGTPAEGGTPTNDNTAGMSNSGSVNEISEKDVQVTFIPSGFYGTDQYQENINSEKYKKEYEFIKTHDDKEYSVLYKLISDMPKATDEVKANVTFSNGKTKEDIIFKTINGGKVETTWSDNEATLKLKRQFNFAKDEILATVKPKDSTGKYTIAGKLNTWHVQQREINLSLVSVNGTPLSGVKERINEIYNKAGVHFKIDTVHYSTGITTLNNGDSDVLANYTTEERALISYYKSKKGSQKERYYLFFIDKSKITLANDIEGFMPLKRQFGFVFTQSDPGRVAAHELGHGIFGLKHPWDQYNDSSSKEKTDYLMDYGSGTTFSHMDWQKLHAPGIQLYWFQDDEAGEIGGLYWLTPNWEVFTVTNTKSITNKIEGNEYVQGSVPGFKIKKDEDNSIYYYAKFKDDGSFQGYYSNKEKEFYDLKTSILKDNDSIAVFNFNGGCGKNSYYKAKWKDVKGQKGKTPIVAESLRSTIKIIGCDTQTHETSNCDSFAALSYDKEEDVSSLNKYQTKLNESLGTALAEIESRSSVQVRDKGSFNHLQFINGSDFNVLERTKNFEILEDKLHLLAHYTNTYFVVSFLKLESTNTSIPSAILSNMAEKSITENQNFINGKKVVHLIVSSSNYESIFGVGLFNKDVCYSMGYGQSLSDIILSSEVEEGTSPFTDIINVFKTVEKPLNLYTTIIKSDFSIHTLQKKSRSSVRGYPLINALATLKSPYLKIIKQKLRDKEGEVGELKDNASKEEELEYQRKFLKWKQEYDTLILKAEERDAQAIVNNNKDDYFERVNGKIELREVYITDSTFKDGLQMQYAKFHFDKDETLDFLVSIAYTFGDYNELDSKKHFYDGEINPNEVIYGMIDAASLFFAPVGLDTVFDFAGLAFATYNKDTARIFEYSFGVVMFGYAQYGTTFIKSFKLAKLKKADDSYEYIIKRAEDELEGGEELLAEIVGKNIDDARNRLRSEGFIADIIDGVGEISTANHMLVLGGDLAETSKRLLAIETQNVDNVIDIVVHGADNKIIIDGKEVTDEIVNIKKWLEDNHPDVNKVRLLSCTNLEGAQDFANKLGDKLTVQATNGYVRVHNDGLVSVVAREPNGSTEWYELGANRQEKVLPENARPRGPDTNQLDDAAYVDDFLELSTRTLDEINWATLLKQNPSLAKKVEDNLSDLEQRARFVSDLLTKKGVKKPKILQRELLFKYHDQITETHIRAWKILQNANPELGKRFVNLDGFAGIINRFDELSDVQKEDFIKVLSYIDAMKIDKVVGDDLIVNNLSELKVMHIDAWLKLREYPQVNAKYNFKDLDLLGKEKKSAENIVLDYGERDGNLESLLKLFGYDNAAYAAKWAGKVSDYNIEALNKLTGEAYERMKKAYTFEIINENGDKITYAVKGNDWKGFFKELKESGHFNGFQSHHIFVVEALKRSEGYRKWYDKMGHTVMDINGKHHDGLLNLIMLEGYTKPKGVKPEMGVHANHGNYNKTLIDFFNARWKDNLKKSNNVDDAIEVFGEEVLKVQAQLNELLLEKCVVGYKDASGKWIRTKVDDLINEEVLKSML
ncbi:Fibronectin type III domain-containing protein [Tenacibaculum sp. MAR_2009_124]|uniref:fibronectin type III domain-containing protein n=1 Tax=Tenacibaculum sp. MAR_2009_124 TaxID=1250059 RepID=UPI0008943E27|nr:fibronectin type III domain-containing protein [Tenacibaculum sp. MAR_2009_124]SEB52361.1 Fibronectin type III domain-containing protein [Tenacibaculum sp. MAR_2009_124]